MRVSQTRNLDAEYVVKLKSDMERNEPVGLLPVVVVYDEGVRVLWENGITCECLLLHATCV